MGRNAADVGTTRLMVELDKNIDSLKREAVVFGKREQAAKSPDAARLHRAIKLGLIKVAETSPDGGILHLDLQMFIRTMGGGSRPLLSREEQSTVMAVITDRVTRLMKAEHAHKERQRRERRYQQGVGSK